MTGANWESLTSNDFAEICRLRHPRGYIFRDTSLSNGGSRDTMRFGPHGHVGLIAFLKSDLACIKKNDLLVVDLADLLWSGRWSSPTLAAQSWPKFERAPIRGTACHG